MRRAPELRLLTLSLLLLGACSGDGIERVDSRFSTPEHTVRTLFTAYGIEGLTQAQARARLLREGRLRVRDPELLEACYLDLDSQGAANLTGYVIGALAAGKDQLRTEIFRDRATVSPREGVEIVLRRQRVAGRSTASAPWRIALRESVPEDVQRQYGGQYGGQHGGGAAPAAQPIDDR